MNASIQKIRLYTFDDENNYTIRTEERAASLSPADEAWTISGRSTDIRYVPGLSLVPDQGAQPYLLFYNRSSSITLTFNDAPAKLRLDAAFGLCNVRINGDADSVQLVGDFSKHVITAKKGRIQTLQFLPESGVGAVTLMVRKLETASDIDDEFGA